jgi:hypothetical protein
VNRHTKFREYKNSASILQAKWEQECREKKSRELEHSTFSVSDWLGKSAGKRNRES